MTTDSCTISETWLNVGDGHALYVHDWGNPNADKTILFLHGGPGGGCNDVHKQLFDPQTQRVIFFDQRGAGNSTPAGSIEHNTTQDLMADINKILAHFKLETVVINGGSWGSCLALAYAITHPRHVDSMVLRGIYTGSSAEQDWVDKGKFKEFYPEVWQSYLDATPDKYHDNPTAYHFRTILGADEDNTKESAYAYNNLLGGIMKLDDRFEPSRIEDFDTDVLKLEAHYFTNNCFVPDNFILANANKITAPVAIIQGRYDMVCPPIFAYKLHQALPNSHIHWYIGGHHNEHESWNMSRVLLQQATGRSAA